jgi:tRNA G18 (ribose-2'-O)-methylase SpoU
VNVRGYFEIGIVNGKTPQNLGTLWRSAYQLGAAGVFTIGQRYVRQSSDVFSTPAKLPLRHYDTFDDFVIPHGAPVVAIEMGGKPLPEFRHPESAVYVLGAEDNGLPPKILARAHHVVSLPSIRDGKFNSFNVAVAGALVMYDRMSKQLKA